MITLQANGIAFNVSEDASSALYTAKELSPKEGSDFFRLILDDGLHTEIPVFSHAQKGRAYMENEALIIEYDKLVSNYGDTYDVALKITVTVEDGLLSFVPEIDNRSSVRVNECFCPLADFTGFGGEKKEDAVYFPRGLGSRVKNPWQILIDKTTDYYSHDQNEVYWHLHYPLASMGWFGVQSADHFLYIGRHDPDNRHCFMTIRQKIHSRPANMMLGIDHFPMARPGERLTLPQTVIGWLEGDWRQGAKIYRRFAESTFYSVPEKAEWVKELTGWQRVIMRSQYGEDYFKAEDLPELYKIGAKYGIHTIFLFAWWKEGMDRAYPKYEEPYPGAFNDLRENIEKVQALGGRVILECNCHFMDRSSDFYKEHGEFARMLDINGEEVSNTFVYPGYGEVRVTYGKKPFVYTCSSTELWRNQVLNQIKLLVDLGADCAFADCYGAFPCELCFNDKHEHKNRVDEDWKHKKKFFEEAMAYCKSKGRVLATEVVTDVCAGYSQFIHGWDNVEFTSRGNHFPAMFRYTFPEVITTERGIRDEEGDFRRRMRCALVYGLRLDAELYVCRTHLDDAPLYAEAVKEHTDTLYKYREFMMDGTFTCIEERPLPPHVRIGEYISKDRTRVLRVLYNPLDIKAEFDGIALDADEMRFDIYDVDSYCK